MKKSIVLVLLILLGWSCIYKLENPPQKSGVSYLTVNAELSDLNDVQSIILSYSVAYGGENIDYIRYAENATVYITDDLGNQINYSQGPAKGQYISYSPGIVGRTYTLHIQTSDGKKYISNPETLKPCPAIDKVYYKFTLENKYPASDLRRYGFNVFVDFNDPVSPDDFYQWNWTHYEKIEYCASCIGGIFEIWDSTCVPYPSENGKNNLFPCNGDCWDISRNITPNLLADTYYNGKSIQGIPINRISYINPPSQYYLEIQQRAISKSVYLYQKSIQVQTQSNGTLFDVPAQTHFNLNINSETNPEEKILGIFNVFSVKKKIIYVDRTGPIDGIYPSVITIPGEIFLEGFPPQPRYIPCINSLTRRNTPPEDWK